MAGSADLDGVNGLPNWPAILNSCSVGARLRSSGLRLIFLGGCGGAASCVVLPLTAAVEAVDCACFPDVNLPVPAAKARMPWGKTVNSSNRMNVINHLQKSAVILAEVTMVL